MQRVRPLMEKHVQTVLLSIITAGILFGCNLIFSLSIGMAKVQVTLEQLSDQSKNYVTIQYISEHDRQVDQQFQTVGGRIDKLENTVDALRQGKR